MMYVTVRRDWYKSTKSWLETVATEAAARTLGKEGASTVATDPEPWQPLPSSKR